MKKMNKFVFILLLLLSCGNKQDDKYQYVDKQQSDKEDVKNSLEKANRYLLVQEAEYINDYIERHKLNVIQTGTGLRYQIVSQGDGELICEGELGRKDMKVVCLMGV